MSKLNQLFWPALCLAATALVAGCRGGAGQDGITEPTSAPISVGQQIPPHGNKAKKGGQPGTSKHGAQKPTGAVPGSKHKPAPKGQPGLPPGKHLPVAGGATGGAPTAHKPVVTALAIPHRSDPFSVPWRKPPPPPYVFTQVAPLQLANVQVPPPAPVNATVREEPSRRVSGIMTGDGVYAILEDASGNVEIVQPGSVTSDQYRVVSINKDSVKLERKVAGITYVQVVPLSDTSLGPTSGTGSLGGRPGLGGGRPGNLPAAGGGGGAG
ncbi:MAG: hypothetical protein KGJ62_08915 [Armatimonadetes bacterium]|nr:hypothetical protein [Armatimonadota bacterium]MDE2206460.1 hypothetical protein [Armatimonadota bacterium]